VEVTMEEERERGQERRERDQEHEREVRELYAALLAAWTYPAGTPVTVTLDDGSPWETETRSAAWALGHGAPVVLLEGKSGGYALERVRLRLPSTDP
jgi:hypothetical protein